MVKTNKCARHQGSYSTVVKHYGEKGRNELLIRNVLAVNGRTTHKIAW